MEVYVSRFPSGGGKARVSTAGGTHPRWRRDGKELFYVSNDSRMMAADDVTPDGQRFLVIIDVGVQPPLTVVTNWRAGK